MIQRALKSDLPDILNLQKQAFQRVAEIIDCYHIAPLTQTLEQTEQEFERSLFLKKIENERIVGSVRAYTDAQGACHVGRLIVHPEYQKKGIGHALMLEIEKSMQPCECYEIFTGSEFEGTIRLYKRLGYVESETKSMDHVSMQFMIKRNHPEIAGEPL